MRKFLKHFPFNKVFTALFVLFYTFLPSAQAIGIVMEESSVDDSTKVDISEDILEDGISDPKEIANPEVLEEEIPESTFEDGMYTVNSVGLKEYVYPDNEDVRVKFTNITEEGNLVISKVELTEEEKEELNTYDDYGWDISSSMSNGSFTYDLTLPNTSGNDDVEVKYTEDGEVYESIDNSNIEIKSNVVTIKGLDHFTLFVVSEVNKATYWDWVNRTKQWTIEYEEGGSAQYVQDPAGDVLQKGREIGLGSDYILMTRPGTRGRAYLGYDGFDSTLNDSNGPTLSETLIKEISWQSYSAKSPHDHYLNIYLRKGLTYATIVYIPSVGTANEWNTYSTDSPGDLYVKKGNKSISYPSMSDLINAYGDWRIRPDSSTKSGITIVSGSSNSGPEIENYIDYVKIYYTNGVVDTYTFENSTDNTSPIPTFSTTISSPTNQTSILVNLTFNEDVYELENNDLALTNATISSFTKVSQSEYQINISPEDSGAVTISIPQGAVFDATGNPNTFASFTTEYEPDNVAPISNISIQADLNETPNLTHNNGWHGGGWYYNFDNIILSIENPEDGDFINYQIMDGDFSEPGQNWTSAGSNWIDLAQPINEKGDGIYTIFWYAKDSAGNTETPKREVVKIDRTNPTYTIDFDSINGLKNNNITYIKDNKIQIEVKVEDALSGYTRARYDLHIADENWNCTYKSTNEDNLVPAGNNTNRTLTVSDLSDGKYCLKIWVYDDVQNKALVDTNGEQWVYFIIDTTPPSAPILTGSPVQYVKWGNVTRTWSASSSPDVDYYMYKNITNGWTSGPHYAGLSEYSITHNTGNYDRIFEWKVSAVDYAGNETWSEDTYKVFVDGTKPSIEIVSPQTDNSYQNSTFDVIVTAKDTNSGLNKVVVHIYGESNTIVENCDVSSLGGTSTYTVTCNMNTTKHSDGIYTIKTNAYDLAGNMSQTLSRSFTIDTTAPEVVVTSHNDGDFVNENIIITGEVIDLNLSHYWFVITNSSGNQVAGPGKVPTSTNPTQITLNWNTGNVPDGEYIIKLEAMDLVGNKDPNEAPVSNDPEVEGDSVDWVTVIVDNKSPIIEKYSDMTLIEGTAFPTTGTVNLTETNLDKVYISISDSSDTHTEEFTATSTFLLEDSLRQTIEEWKGSSFTTINLNVLPEGTYNISYYATDKAGNVSTTQTFVVTIQNNPPVVTITPSLTEVTAGTPVVLSASVTGGNESFTYAWSGACSGSEAITTFNTDTPGTYTCTVTVTDADGDTTTDNIEITVLSIPTLPPTTAEEVLGAIFTPKPVQASTQSLLGTGGYLYTQATNEEQDTEEEETTKEETVTQEEDAEVKGEEDNGEQNSEEETTEEEGTKWWVYPLVILPVLAIFLILWKRRKEEDEPQF